MMYCIRIVCVNMLSISKSSGYIIVSRRWIHLVPLFVNNEFKTSLSGKVASPVVNPATEEVIAHTPQPTLDELNQVAAIAHEAFQSWRHTPVAVRTRYVVKFGELVRQNQEELARIVSSELGKTHEDAMGSVFRGLEVVEHAYATPSLIMGETLQSVSKNIDTYSFREPLGVCAGICPFNFPVMIPLWMFPLAAACGNTYILKPSEKVPLASVKLMELALEAGFPPGVINMVHGGKETVDWICDDERIKAISFVGGNAAGEYIYARGTANGKRVQSNMGAKNHVVILPDADKEDTLNLVANAAFGAAGQRCMALSVPIFVGEARRWIPEFVEKAKQFTPSVEYGPQVTKEAKTKIATILAGVEQSGAKLLLDGRENTKGGNYMGPSVISESSPGMECYDSEIFGPVAVCTQVDSLDDAIALINKNKFGNGTAIFTSCGASARKFQSEIEVGQVGINLPIPVAVPQFSFTGWKDSMRGDVFFNGKQGVSFFTRTKTITARWKEIAGAASKISGSFPTLK